MLEPKYENVGPEELEEAMAKLRQEVFSLPSWFLREEYLDGGTTDDPKYLIEISKERPATVNLGSDVLGSDLWDQRLPSSMHPGISIKQLTHGPLTESTYWNQTAADALISRLDHFMDMYWKDYLQPTGQLPDGQAHPRFRHKRFQFAISFSTTNILGKSSTITIWGTGSRMFAPAKGASGATAGHVSFHLYSQEDLITWTTERKIRLAVSDDWNYDMEMEQGLGARELPPGDYELGLDRWSRLGDSVYFGPGETDIDAAPSSRLEAAAIAGELQGIFQPLDIRIRGRWDRTTESAAIGGARAETIKAFLKTTLGVRPFTFEIDQDDSNPGTSAPADQAENRRVDIYVKMLRTRVQYRDGKHLLPLDDEELPLLLKVRLFRKTDGSTRPLGLYRDFDGVDYDSYAQVSGLRPRTYGKDPDPPNSFPRLPQWEGHHLADLRDSELVIALKLVFQAVKTRRLSETSLRPFQCLYVRRTGLVMTEQGTPEPFAMGGEAREGFIWSCHGDADPGMTESVNSIDWVSCNCTVVSGCPTVGRLNVLDSARGPVLLPPNFISPYLWASNRPLFAWPRVGNRTSFYVDGAAAMGAMATALQQAEKFVYLSNWAITPDIALVRPEGGAQSTTLQGILTAISSRGVQTRILLWNSVDSIDRFTGIYANDIAAEETFQKLSPNIRVVRHRPYRPSLSWSHHQKSAVVDGKVAFVGGVDLRKGRWDTPNHPLPGNDHETHGDFYNPQISDWSPNQMEQTLPVNPESDVPQSTARAGLPLLRMPWHDVHVGLYGPSALDVHLNFVWRWNHHIDSEPRNTQPSGSPPYPQPQPFPPPDPFQDTTTLMLGADACYFEGVPIDQHLVFPHCDVQIARSIQRDAGGGPDEIERGIHEVYCNAIRDAQYYIHIENQFFIAHNSRNKVVETLYERLSRAIRNDEKLKVSIILPVFPEGSLKSGSVKELFFWQSRTISREPSIRSDWSSGPPTLLKRLRADIQRKFPTYDDAQTLQKISEYLNFFNLRAHATYQTETTTNGGPVPVEMEATSQIYVHAKCLIVDDRIAIIGSANINDRSMMGDRDSEIAAVIVDEEQVDSEMAGLPFKARVFAHQLRLRLWMEHLGKSPTSDDPSEREEQLKKIMSSIRDPVASYDDWLETAKTNTEIYESCFGGKIPANSMQELPGNAEELAIARITKEEFDEILARREAADLEAAIRGHLTLMPLEWLAKATLESLSVGGDELYQ